MAGRKHNSLDYFSNQRILSEVHNGGSFLCSVCLLCHDSSGPMVEHFCLQVEEAFFHLFIDEFSYVRRNHFGDWLVHLLPLRPRSQCGLWRKTIALFPVGNPRAMFLDDFVDLGRDSEIFDQFGCLRRGGELVA